MMRILELQQIDADQLAQLVALLRDCVHGGASVGFLAPLSGKEASRYWQQLARELHLDSLRCWVALYDGQIVGSVQLSLCGKANGRHRGEIQKLLVHSAHRGRGIAGRLMQAAEQAARNVGRTLLVLDTDSESVAASLYPRLGWLPAGDIPHYAASPDGQLHATRYFYKQLG
ncbi:GNAT family N-acetyltransferase [Vogesella sp. LIG4]|uniref:GNAT family N-acetyltransferase n=1 Tax=Vogesella sp. LIG4 TaxID=1192162 RepID=UPI000B5AF94D|nr:GNAT family N-acetyltransferase [Vogesella sp. LIG4]